MKTVDKLLEIFEKVCSFVSTILLVGMLFSLSVQVISRYIFNTGFAWTEESARYMMVAMVFFGAVVCTKQGIHVAVDAIEELLPRTATILKIIQYAIMIGYSGIVFVYGIQILKTASAQTSPNMKIPMNYIYLVFPIAMILIGLYSLRHLIAIFRKETYGGAIDEITAALEEAREGSK